ncbi:hypothetical protein BCR41DRAFT_55850 [Lobosporangium transversale]|uniref:Pentacotripeptide-repeat region of PRORP domain-containing protein n=1 Tax=Lobosporangium transversale TaxID=64571 RepID=A0A1Y2GNS8_9FUNG|nr:hypothetical protein BCR41DRAFT_55850 [Lobosporangium transversale]ORZ16770.1 hypothetical protein BCR41DRAFT_55850 [Lobosporangium transversale]|eukprot:XP_021881705.1 hypothetical protein BCR41DRAFT_55850 [Lobosporangium transversale]
MPLLSRVLRPATKRKSPIRKQGPSSTYLLSPFMSPKASTLHTYSDVSATRSRRSIGHCVPSSCHHLNQELMLHLRLSRLSRTPQSHFQKTHIATFSDLYPIFRLILESRSHVDQQSYQLRSKGSGATCLLQSNNNLRVKACRRSSTTFTLPKNSCQLISGRIYSRERNISSHTHTSHSLPLPSSATSIQYDSSFRKETRSIIQSGRNRSYTPCRSISHQHSMRTLEDVTDLRIPEEFLPIDSSHQIVIPPSPTTFKNWVVSQISCVRDLFQKQSYMQALVVIDKAKEHEYMKGFSTNPSLASNVTLRHLQDLHLVEYCCRLVCAHEATIGNIDIVETMTYLNSVCLEPIKKLQTRGMTDYRTTFQLSHDPLIDYTLAVLTRSWNRLFAERENENLPLQELSADQAALASTSLPFLKALIVRRLFPSSTSILEDPSAVNEPRANPRRATLEICLASNDRMSAMQCIWLWERRDREDWLCLWSQIETRQWLFTQFLQDNRPDWVIDLFRLASRATGRPQSWIQDLLDITSSLLPPESSFIGIRTLREILRLSEMDATAFSKKKQFYNLDSWKRPDQIRSWLSGLQELTLVFSSHKYSTEVHLWREIAMTGVLLNTLEKDDIARSINPMALMTDGLSNSLLQHHLTNSIPSPPLDPGVYSDSLTELLEEKSAIGTNTSTLGEDFALFKGFSHQNAVDAPLLLKQTIRDLMSHCQPDKTSTESILNTYKIFLHDIAHHAAFRLGNLGLLSQVMELRFQALYGDANWKKTIALVRTEGTKVVSRQHRAQGPHNLEMVAMDEVREFVTKHMGPTLAKICAFKTMASESSMKSWDGQLSDWVMAIANTSVTAGSMATIIKWKRPLEPGHHAFSCVLTSLLDSHELDLAASLYTHAYGPLHTCESKSLKSTLLTTGKLRMLIQALATSEKDPRHLEQAQWIFDRHLELESAQLESKNELSQCSSVDIHIVTELAGAWFRRAEFSKARHVMEIMWKQSIQPNMVFYNTLLKSLLDLTPQSRAGRRSMASGKQHGMRDLGRNMMVRQLIKSKNQDVSFPSLGSNYVRSELDDGWDLFQSVIHKALEAPSKNAIEPTVGLDAMSVVKNLISQSSPLSSFDEGRLDIGERTYKGEFRPDAYTFSILLGAFALRGEIEPMSELFVEMKQLKIEPDAVVCSILANAFAKKGDLKAVGRVTQEARNRNMDPGLYLTNMVLDSLVESGVSAQRLREALDSTIAGIQRLDTEMLDLDSEIEIPVHRPSNIHSLRGQQQGHNRNYDRGAMRSEQTVAVNHGIDGVTLTTLIKYHTRQNDLRSAQEILQLMFQAGYVPDTRAYILLLAASIRTRDIFSGLSTIRAMRTQTKEFPDAKAWKGLLRCALDLETSELFLVRKRQQQQQGQDTVPSWISGLLSNPDVTDSHVMHSRGQFLVFVLKELEVVLNEINRAQMDAAFDMSKIPVVIPTKRRVSPAADYLWKILTTSWISVGEDQNKNKDMSIDSRPKDGDQRILNPEVKGKNGLLRRLFNHLLREPNRTIKSDDVIQQSEGEGESDVETEVGKRNGNEQKQSSQGHNLREPRRHRRCCDNPDQHWYAGLTVESIESIEQRCEHAIWLVRLVEGSGIELGSQWKWSVVGRKIRALTGREPAAVKKQLNRHGYD